MNHIHTRLCFLGIASLLTLSLTACGGNHEQHQIQSDEQKNHEQNIDMPFQPTAKLNQPIGDFTYTDQDNHPFGLSDLKEKVWIADLIFTQCEQVCPIITPNMVQLQKKLQEEGLDMHLVSFSVDPEYDQPAVLKQYAQQYGVDFSSWHFLTGYSYKEIQDFTWNNFQLKLEKKEENSKHIKHGRSFYLIDSTGRIVREYDGTNPDYDAIIKDIKSL